MSYGDDIALTLSISPDAAAPKTRMAPVMANIATLNAAQMQSLATGLVGISGLNLPPALLDEGMGRIYEILAEPLAERMALSEANESKWVFEAGGRIRRETVGPNEFSVKATWEIGPGQKELETFRTSDCGRALYRVQASAESISGTCVEEFAEAVVDATNDPLTFHQARIAFSLEGKWLEANEVRIADPLVEIPGKNSHSIAIAASGGYDVFTGTTSMPDKSTKRGRLDFSLTYDDVTDDPLRNDRLIASITYTQRAGEELQFPITLMYASDSDYLTNVDRKLNAHFGISYKVPSKK
ncbi:MAG: hypothetical protein ACXW28_11730 [Thermoanaerobaculia bacterium]